MDKTLFRKELLARRNQMFAALANDRTTACNIEKIAQCFQNFIPEQTCYKNAENILVYVSYNSEFPTRQLIEDSIACGKRVYVPKVEGKRHMEFYEIKRLNDLVEGYQGILEPTGNEPVFDPATQSAVMFVPGLAFCKNTSLGIYRIGYGGGYYDTYLKKTVRDRVFTIGIGYDFQIVDKLPLEEHDETIDTIYYYNTMKNEMEEILWQQ
ncbi:MAG: 5-formyltetrahydrofolate cyclo-ligase [Lachnospiraceae bacterium]|nr:5-formyltetrahydrofolate cyclo-ligase [Lachnospiraceae bacterium]